MVQSKRVSIIIPQSEIRDKSLQEVGRLVDLKLLERGIRMYTPFRISFSTEGVQFLGDYYEDWTVKKKLEQTTDKS
jgi:hypothetical protein